MKILSRDILAKDTAPVEFPKDFRLDQKVREIGAVGNGHRIYEFIGTDTFSAEWNTRRQYEIDAGRDNEPILYEPFYRVIQDASLPRNVTTYFMGPGGVVFQEYFEGGEVKFASVGSSNQTVPIRHWAQGLEYSKDLVVFNELWNVAIVERQVGQAHNALLNHLHFNPILTYSYAAANQTAFNSTGSSTQEDYLLTLEDAIVNSKTDSTNPRRGPYALLVATSNLFMWQKALQIVPQQGVSLQASGLFPQIRAVVAYDGWTGQRGSGVAETYSGVTTDKAYLVSLTNQDMDLQSFEKQALANQGTETDLSRFMTQTVWDSYYGVYANPIRCVEEVSLS
jgi:hypothetical protein